MSLADLFNAPSGIVYEDKTYALREPTALECGQYQRHLEQQARAAAARAVELEPEDRRNLLRDVTADIAANVYAWGGELCVKSLRTVDGIAKLMSIVCHDRGVTEALAKRICDRHLRECVAILAGASDDPNVRGQLPALLAGLGLPPDFLSNLSSGSATRPSGAPPTSPPSATSA